MSLINAMISTKNIPKVFMVDDMQSICLQIGYLFTKQQVEFEYCLEAHQAINEIERYRPSVIIQDLYMPHKNGFELLKEYRAHPIIKEIPVLIFSAERDAHAINKLLSLGANDFLYKDTNREELIARVLYYSSRFNSALYKQSTNPPDSNANNFKVFVADPSKITCRIVQKLLNQQENISFAYCLDSYAVIDDAAQYEPDIIFITIFQNNQWLDLIGQIRCHPVLKKIPVIVCAPFEDALLRKQTKAVGATEYLVNTTSNKELIEKINAYAHQNKTGLKKILDDFYQPHDIFNVNVRLLMVDDSKSICASFEKLLSSEKNIHISFCHDPLQALKIAKQYDPTIVLMDLEMPNVTGLELLAIFRKDEFAKEIPIIILSAIGDPSIKAKSFALGANDYMGKAMDKIELISRIQYHSRCYINSIQLKNTIQELTDMQRLLKSQSLFIRKTFGRYLSDDIVNSILETPEGLKLGGESRGISIMMTDLRGFTPLSETLPAESVLSIINNFLSVMTELLLKYHATIDEFIGDAILAIFGAPVSRNNDALRSVACAIEMQLAMKKVNHWNQEHGFPNIAMGIGIHTGDAVVGNIGSEKRAKYGIVGHNVNLTSRIESYTTGGQIYISENTLRECGNLLRVDSQIQVSPKGVKSAITIYEIGGIYGEYNLFLPEKQQPLSNSLPITIS